MHHSKSKVYLFCILLMIILPTHHVIAMTDVQLLTSVPGNKDADWFGFALDLDNQILVTGIPKDDTLERNAGAVEIGSLSDQTYIPQLRIYGEQKSAQFGYAVAVSDNIIAVGSPYYDNGNQPESGSVQIWMWINNEWQYIQNIVGEESNDRFGWSLDLDGTYLVVGAPDADNSNGEKSGVVYVYQFDGSQWILDKKIDGEEKNSEFGKVVTIDDDIIAVSAPRRDFSDLSNSGEVQLWQVINNVWVLEQRIGGLEKNDQLGSSLDLDRGRLVIGSPYADTSFEKEAGHVQVWHHDAGLWNLEIILEGTRKNSLFGDAVALSNNTIVVGSPRTDVDDLDRAGAFYVWELVGTSWLLRHIEWGMDEAEEFASGLTADNDILVSGTYHANPLELKEAGRIDIYMGINQIDPDGCRVDAPNLAYIHQNIPVILACNNVNQVYGFQASLELAEGLEYSQTQFIDGTIFETQSDYTLTLVNDVSDGFGLTLRQPAVPVSGDFTLGSTFVNADIEGLYPVSIDSLILGNILGEDISVSISEPIHTIQIFQD